ESPEQLRHAGLPMQCVVAVESGSIHGIAANRRPAARAAGLRRLWLSGPRNALRDVPAERLETHEVDPGHRTAAAIVPPVPARLVATGAEPSAHEPRDFATLDVDDAELHIALTRQGIFDPHHGHARVGNHPGELH